MVRLVVIHSVLLGLVLAVVSATDAQTRSRQPRRMLMSVTAYCVEGETKSGIVTREGIVAADPQVLPIGSVIRVAGLRGRWNGTYTVADTGRAVKGREIDIFMESCATAKRFGRQEARIRVLKVGSGEIAGADRK